MDGVFNSEADSFKRESCPGNISSQQPPQFQTSGGGAPSGRRSLALNADVISDILAAMHAMPSWKACKIEDTSWTGTAEENIQKYVASVATEYQ